MFCPNCGSPLDKGSSNCAICGSAVSGAVMPPIDVEPEAVVYSAHNAPQEESYVRASLQYQTFACPNCGMNALIPDASGIIAHCKSCGSDIDIRTRKITVERHEHTHNYITYQTIGDHFDLSHDGTVVRGLTATGATGAANVVIPEKHGITAVGDGFLFGSETTESVVLPEGIQRIGASAFCNCRKLKEIVILATVRMIDSSAFENCSSLRRISIPNDVRLGENVFRGCSGLREVVIGDNVLGGMGAFIACTSLVRIEIGAGSNVANSMFANCPALTHVELKGMTTLIDEYAFCDCISLTEICFPVGLKSLGGAAFRGCSALVRVGMVDSLSYIGTNAFEDCKRLVEVNCTSVTRFGDGVFKGCTALVQVTLNRALSAIPPSMFEGCAQITSIDIPSSCTKIGIRSFAGCVSLNACILPQAISSIPQEAFEGCLCLTEVGGQPFNVSTRAFADCTNLKKITVKGDVSPRAFEGCRNLEDLTFADETRIIGDAAFMNASALTSLIVPNGVEVVDSSAFQGCVGLRRVVLAASVQAVDHWAFYGCTGLEVVVFAGKASGIALSDGAFGNDPLLVEIMAPMQLFMDETLSSMIAEVPTISNIKIPDYDEARVKGLKTSLFGDRTVCVNGEEVQWRSWIEAHYPAPEGDPVDISGVSDTKTSPKKKGLFGIFK